MKIHDFKECLERSHSYSNELWWEKVYKKAFPTFKTMNTVDVDGWAQRGGIDRIILLESGKTIYIDEKVREKAYDDFFLEYWSSLERKIKGWIAKDLATDYIAYAFAPIKKCYLLPFQLLRAAWKQNRVKWCDKYFVSKAKNKGYTTEGVCVPIDVVLSSITDSMIIDWDDI